MKKFAVALLVAALAVSSVFAADNKPAAKAAPKASGMTSYYNPGTLSAMVGIGSAFYDITIAGGVELTMMKFDIPEVMPISIGVAGRGAVEFWAGDMYLDVAALGTAHFGFDQIGAMANFEPLKKVDVYIGLGLGLGIIKPSYWNTIRFAAVSGLSYFFNDHMAVGYEYLNLCNIWSNTIFLTFKL
jgi:opacity protein-like surface antigen